MYVHYIYMQAHKNQNLYGRQRVRTTYYMYYHPYGQIYTYIHAQYIVFIYSYVHYKTRSMAIDPVSVLGCPGVWYITWQAGGTAGASYV